MRSLGSNAVGFHLYQVVEHCMLRMLILRLYRLQQSLSCAATLLVFRIQLDYMYTHVHWTVQSPSTPKMSCAT